MILAVERDVAEDGRSLLRKSSMAIHGNTLMEAFAIASAGVGSCGELQLSDNMKCTCIMEGVSYSIATEIAMAIFNSQFLSSTVNP